MGTDIQKQTALPSPTPQHDKSLTPQGLQDHRASLIFEVRVALSAYFQPHEVEEIKAAQLAWWADELQDWTREQVVYGLRQWNRENPRARPTPGDILAILMVTRGKKEAERYKASLPPPPPEPEPRILTAEELAHRKAVADDILRGFSKRIDAAQP